MATQRVLFVLYNRDMRRRAHDAIDAVPDESRVEIKGPKRTLPQNARFWAMLTDISEQAEHFGRKYSTEDWKLIFLSGLNRENRFAPNLDGDGVVPLGRSSSDLSIEEMGELMELMASWGVQHGVVFQDRDPNPRSTDLDAA